MIRFRDEGGVILQGLNIYPRKSANLGFILAIGRFRFMLRYSKLTGLLDCFSWREDVG